MSAFDLRGAASKRTCREPNPLLATRQSLAYRPRMSTRVVFTLAACLVAIASFVGCKKDTPSHTTILNTWQNPQREGPALRKLMVIGVARTQSARERYEMAMADAVRKQGADAEASYVAVGDSRRLTLSQARAAVDEGGFDGVILTHVLSIEEQVEQIEGKTTTVPTSNADLYMFDYDQRYEEVKEPDHYEVKRTYTIETIVYDAATGEKLWYTVSETTNPASVDHGIDEIASTTAQKMKEDSVIE